MLHGGDHAAVVQDDALHRIFLQYFPAHLILGRGAVGGNVRRHRRHIQGSRRRQTVAVAILSMAASFIFAEPIVNAFINDPETIRLGTEFLKARCLAMPFMIIGFQIVNFMQAVNQGKTSFLLTIIRHVLLNIPALIIMNMIWGITGLIWAQTVSDIINAVIACIIYYRVHKSITAPQAEISRKE